MTLEDAPTDDAPLSRRALRAPTGPVVHAPEPAAPPPLALAWLDSNAVLARPAAPTGIDASGVRLVVPDLLADAPRRRGSRAALLTPLLLVLGVAVAYVATALVWPLTAIPPQIETGAVTSVSAPAAAPAWPAAGSAAVGVEGIGDTLASAQKAVPIASITKVVTALLVLDELPLKAGEQGPRFSFSSSNYQAYLASGQSALKVPVGGALTEYQLLEGMLIGSANNYADRIASELWPTDAVYATAASTWLSDHGLDGITVVNPSGFDKGNRATPAALVALARKALANPVIAGIVAKKSVKLPGAGLVENTNGLLADPGVVGVKTGTLDTYSLLSAKDLTVGDTTVRMYAAVLGQKTSKERFAASRALYDQLQKELQPTVAVPAGTQAGRVTTTWGETVDVVTATDAAVVLWNGATAATDPTAALKGRSAKGDVVGSLVVTGPLDARTVELKLAADVQGPSAWWRITHPLELFGIGS